MAFAGKVSCRVKIGKVVPGVFIVILYGANGGMMLGTVIGGGGAYDIARNKDDASTLAELEKRFGEIGSQCIINGTLPNVTLPNVTLPNVTLPNATFFCPAPPSPPGAPSPVAPPVAPEIWTRLQEMCVPTVSQTEYFLMSRQKQLVELNKAYDCLFNSGTLGFYNGEVGNPNRAVGPYVINKLLHALGGDNTESTIEWDPVLERVVRKGSREVVDLCALSLGPPYGQGFKEELPALETFCS